MNDKKLREMAREWFRERSEAWAADVMLAAGMRGPSHEERKRFAVRDRESVRALLQRVRDETRAEERALGEETCMELLKKRRDHSISVGKWVRRDDGYWVIRTGVPRG